MSITSCAARVSVYVKDIILIHLWYNIFSGKKHIVGQRLYLKIIIKLDHLTKLRIRLKEIQCTLIILIEFSVFIKDRSVDLALLTRSSDDKS